MLDMLDVKIVKDSADGLTKQLYSHMLLNTGVFNGRDVIADMLKCSQMRVWRCREVSLMNLASQPPCIAINHLLSKSKWC